MKSGWAWLGATGIYAFIGWLAHYRGEHQLHSALRSLPTYLDILVVVVTGINIWLVYRSEKAAKEAASTTEAVAIRKA